MFTVARQLSPRQRRGAPEFQTIRHAAGFAADLLKIARFKCELSGVVNSVRAKSRKAVLHTMIGVTFELGLNLSVPFPRGLHCVRCTFLYCFTVIGMEQFQLHGQLGLMGMMCIRICARI